jgi:hypothetical protein
VEKDDYVVIFDGSAVPLLLRWHGLQEGSRMYQLVGECYVYGLMQGEGQRLKHLLGGWINLC